MKISPSTFPQFNLPVFEDDFEHLGEQVSERIGLQRLILLEINDGGTLEMIHQYPQATTSFEASEDSLPVNLFSACAHHVALSPSVSGDLSGEIQLKVSNLLELHTVVYHLTELGVTANIQDTVNLFSHDMKNAIESSHMTIEAIHHKLRASGAPEPIIRRIAELNLRLDHIRDTMGAMQAMLGNWTENLSVKALLVKIESTFSRWGGRLDVRADPSVEDRLVTGGSYMMLTTIIQNAVEACSDIREPTRGRVVFTVRGVSKEKVIFQVRDDGPGLEPELKEQLFHWAVSTKGHKRGMGLYLTKRLIQSLGGDVKVESSRSGGTRVELTVPLVSRRHLSVES